MKSWYLIRTKIRQEYTAKVQLERQGYTAYLPLFPTRRRRLGRVHKVIAPMFPRYLFIHLSDQTDDWGPIRSTIGVANLVRFAQAPARVPIDLIDTLKEREDNEGIQVIPNKNYHAGDKVRIAEGPFVGFEGVFQETSSRNRVLLLLQIAEKYFQLQLNPDQIESV